MSDLFASILSEDASLAGGAFLENPEDFVSNVRYNLVRNEYTLFYSEIGSTKIKCRYTFGGGRLQRITTMDHVTAAGKPITILNGLMAGVRGNLEVEVDGEWISMAAFMYHLATAGVSNPTLSLEEFEMNTYAAGFDWAGNGNSMVLTWQQFNATESVIDELIALMTANGARSKLDAIPDSNRGRITSVFDFGRGEGLAVDRMVLQRADRSASRTNQGFLDLFYAQVENFQKMNTLATEARALQSELESKDDITEAVRKEYEIQIRAKRTASKAWINNWAGSQEQLPWNQSTNSPIHTGKWSPVNAPCPEITVTAGGQPHAFQFLTPREDVETDGGSNAAADAVVDMTSSPAKSEENPLD